MNFGTLSELLIDIKNELDNIASSNDEYDKLQVIRFRKSIFQTLKNKYSNLTPDMLDDILQRFFTNTFKYAPDLDFTNGRRCFRNLDEEFDMVETNTKLVKVPKNYKKLEKHFQKLYKTEQPEQKSKEWFDYRHGRITASDTAEAIDLGYSGVENFYVKKCDPTFKFLDNVNVHHGKKLEEVATKIYEHIYNIKVTEFGCLPSEKFKILGASPDGICSKSTLDNKFSDRLGRMLEIKCVTRRQIITEGIIEGHICPFYYWCQVQQQLECCDLEDCDFWQCKIEEYNSYSDYIDDTDLVCRFTEGTNDEEKEINPLITKGCIIQLLPFDFEPEHSQDEHYFKSVYIYPPRMDMTLEEYNEWCIRTINTWKDTHPQWAHDYYFDKVIYWKLSKCHNVLIKRNKEWFSSIYPLLEETWNKVEYYRKNQKYIKDLKIFAEKRSKFYKLNTTLPLFTLNNDFKTNVIENKVLFLDSLKVEDDESDCDVDFLTDSDED